MEIDSMGADGTRARPGDAARVTSCCRSRKLNCTRCARGRGLGATGGVRPTHAQMCARRKPHPCSPLLPSPRGHQPSAPPLDTKHTATQTLQLQRAFPIYNAHAQQAGSDPHGLPGQPTIRIGNVAANWGACVTKKKLLHCTCVTVLAASCWTLHTFFCCRA
jgi:hypothetical protein